MNPMQIERIARALEATHEDFVKMNKALNVIARYLRPEEMAANIEFFTTINGLEMRVTKMILQQGQDAVVKLKIKDIFGNPAKVQDDKVEWSLSDPALGALVVDLDMMGAKFVSSGVVGKAMLQAKGDADLGEGVEEIMGQLELEVLSGKASVFELSAEAVPKVA